MDGPSVNHKFLDNLKEDFQSDKSDPALLDIGTCGLHVVHGAFKTGKVCFSYAMSYELK